VTHMLATCAVLRGARLSVLLDRKGTFEV